MLGHLRELIIDIRVGRIARDGDEPGRIKFVILPCRSRSHCRLASFPHHHIHEMMLREADIGAELYLQRSDTTDAARTWSDGLDWAHRATKAKVSSTKLL